MKTDIVNKVRAVFWSALWIIPIPFGIFVSDRRFFVSLSVPYFFLTALIITLMLRRRDLKRHGQSAYAAAAYLFYGNVIGAIFATAFLGTLRETELWKFYILRLGVYFLWLLGTLFLQAVLAWLFEYWYANRRHRLFAEFIDPLMYALPLPTALMALFFFPAVNFAGVSGPEQFITGLFGLFFFVNTAAYNIFIIAAFAFYFYPAKTRYPFMRDRVFALFRLVFMVCVFIFVQTAVNMMTGLWAYEFQYLTARNNPLIFILPLVSYTFFMWAAIGMGNALTVLKTAVWKQ